MRFLLLACLASALVLPATVHAQGTPERPDTIIAVRAGHGEIALVWTPVPTAVGYVIYRGPSLVTLQPIAIVSTSYFFDPSPSPDIWYGVASTDLMGHVSTPHSTNTGQQGQACVSSNGDKYEVHAEGCVPGPT